MLKNVLRKVEWVKHVKCVKCGKRDSTKDDQLCDSCRFTLTLESVIESKE